MNYPLSIQDLFYQGTKEAMPSYGSELPQNFTYDPGATSSLFELGYFPQQGFPLLATTLVSFLIFCLILLFFRQKRKSSDLTFFIFLGSLFFVFFGPLSLPSFFKINTTLGLAKLIGALLLIYSLIESFFRKKFDFFYTRSFLPLSFYILSLLVSVFFITNLNFFLTDLSLVITGVLFFYLGFYFLKNWRNLHTLLVSLAWLTLFPALLVLFIFIFNDQGKEVIKVLYPRYENFVFLHDLSRGRILSVIDLEFFTPCIFYLFLSQKESFKRFWFLIVFFLSSMAIFLTNYRYRFLTFIVAIAAFIFFLKDKSKKIFFKFFTIAFTAIFGFYLLVMAFLGGQYIVNRFLLQNYENDVDSLRRRGVMMSQAWNLFLKFPVFGVGVGNYKDNVDVVYERFGGRVYEPFYKILQNVYAYPHNWFLLVLAENGIVGFFILLWLLYVFLKSDIFLYKRLKEKQFLMFLTISATSWLYVFANLFTPLHNSLPMVIFFWTFRGMIERIYYNETNGSKIKAETP